MAVEDRHGAPLGKAVEALLECGSGVVTYVVVATGGVGGVAEVLRSVSREAIDFGCDHLSVTISRTAFDALAQAFWRDCTVDAAVLSQWSLTNARQPAIGRIAHLIAELGVRFGIGDARNGTDFEFPLSQMQLGDATNLTSIHVNRMLRQLREANIAVIKDKRVHILDWKQLCAIGEFDPTYLHLHRAD